MSDSTSRTRASVRPLVGVTFALVTFVLAIQFIKGTSDALEPLFGPTVRTVVSGDAAALGASWVATYALLNGSLVAALALALFHGGVIPVSQLYLMLCGTRLGGAAIVVLVGAADFVQKEPFSLREACSLGVLSLLITQSIYLPAALLGYLVIVWTGGVAFPSVDAPEVRLRAFDVVGRLSDAVVSALGPAPTLAASVGLLLVSLRLFDWAIADVDAEAVRARFPGRREGNQPWPAFLLGAAVTMVTTSVSFSLGIVVPLYNRDYLTRREMIPYILGANVGTLVDTLVVAYVLETSSGVGAVLLLGATVTLVTVGVLSVYDRYETAVSAGFDWVLASPARFAGFVLVLVAVPLGLVAVG